MKKKGPPSAADREEAERLKTEGNNLMRTEKFTDALLMYSKVELFTVLYCVLVEQRSLLTLIRTQRSKLLCTSRIEKFANALLMYSKFEYSYVY